MPLTLRTLREAFTHSVIETVLTQIRFKKTQGMKDLLAERARIRSTQQHHEPAGKRVFKEDAAPAERELSSLVQSAKRRADGQSKPRKRSRK